MRPIRLFEFVNLLHAKLDIDRVENLLQMMRFCGADNRRRHAGCSQDPGAGNLGGRHSMLFRYFLSYRRDLEIVVMEIHILLHLIGLRTPGWTFSTFAFPVALKKATSQRTPRNQCDTLIYAERNHLTLLFAIDQIV